MQIRFVRFVRAIVIIAAICWGSLAQGQNLDINFIETPDFIIICGDVDTMIVQVSLDGGSPITRTNISADVQFFKGVRFSELIPSLTTSGVLLDAQNSPGNISLTIPNLSTSSNFADVAFLISADCTYQDSLDLNNTAQVLDVWDFTYDLGASTGLTESDITQQYRDAFKNPEFQMQVNSAIPPLRLNDCLTREIQIDNSGLQGYADSLVYTALQGSGLSITQIYANGIPIPVTKTLSGMDTLVTAVLSSPHFALNTLGNGGPAGNGNGRFDPNETLIITEDLCYVDCSGSLASFHTAGWGCYESICESADVNDFLDSGAGEGFPDADIQDYDEPSFIDLGYCQSGSRAFEVTNTGSEFSAGFGSMMNIEANVLTGNGSDVMDDGIAVTQVTIAGVVINVPQTNNRLDSIPAFTIDPDGPGVGLEDEDGDGYFDDLPVGNSFLIEYLFENQITDRDSLDLPSNCAVNDISTQIFARVFWENSCNETDNITSSFHRIRNLGNDVIQIPDTDAYTDGDTFNVSLELERSITGFDKNCGGNELLIVRVALSPGMNPVFGESNLYFQNNTIPEPAANKSVVNDTLILEFDVSGIPLTGSGGSYRTNLAFTIDCAIPEGRLILPTTVEYFCPSCSDSHLWFCDEMLGPQVHITSPPCVPPTCAEGLKAISFEVNRTTFGFADTDYTIPYDPNLANKKVALECDSIEVNLVAEVGDSTILDSAFVRISYTNIDLSNNLEETFLFGGGNLILKRGFTIIGQESINLSDLSVNSINANKELLFSLDDAITAMGAILIPGDSLFFQGDFQVNSLGPFDNQFRQVPSLRGEMLSIRDGIQYSCDNFGEVFTLAKIRDVVSFPQRTSWPNGSNEVFIQYAINASSNDFDEFFDDEYRPSIKVDSLVILFDKSILDVYEAFEPEISIPNHPIHGQSYYPAPGFDEFPNERYVLRLDTFTSLPELNQVRPNEFSFRIRVIGSSEAVKGSINGDSLYYWEPSLYYSNKYYARTIGDGSCSNDIAHTNPSASDNYFLYNEIPNLSVIPSTDPNQISIGDTLSYEVRVCNLSTLQSAGISWFSFVDSLGTFDLYSIEDITDSGNIQNLSIQQYGTVNSWFGFADGLEQNILSNTFDERCNVFRIKGKLNSCGTHNFRTNTGWNSVPYSNPNWTPDSIVHATITGTNLTARSQDGNLDGSIIQQPTANLGLCDTNEVTIIIRNTDLGRVFDMRTDLYLPSPGFNLVSGSVEVAYPSNTAFIPALADPILLGTDLRGDRYGYADFSSLHTGLDMSGLTGFDNSDPTSNNNELLIKFKFTTDCDFLSGSQIFYDVQGFLGCGDPTNFESGETIPIELSLPTANPNLSYALRFDPKTAFVSNSDGQLNVIINNTGTVASSVADSVEIRLPNNFDYVPGSTNPVIPASYTPGDPVVTIDGPIKSYVWGLPNGVPGGDSIAFNFKVTSPIVACEVDSIGVIAFTRANVSAICSTTGVPCDVEVVTSDASGSLVTELPIFNQTLFVTENTVSSTCASPSTENIYIDGTIENIGNDINDAQFTLYYKLDDNGDQLADPNDIVVDSISFAGPVLGGQTLVWMDTLTMASMEICGLYLYGDTTYLGGCDPLLYFIPSPRVLNAGTDIEHCSLASSMVNYQLGNTDCAANPEFTYNWSSPIVGAISFLSNTSAANPNLNYIYDGSIDTLIYVLETVRSGCLPTRDTILIDMETCSCVAPEIIAEIVIGSRCNESIGGISIDLVADESLYTFNYTEVFTNTMLASNGPEVANIPGGAYRVVIEDIDTGGTCTDSTLIAVPNIDGPQATYTTTNASCSAADGTASLLPLSYNYTWTDGGTGANRTDLLAGTYVVQVESPNVPGCYNYISIEIGVDNGLTASFEIDSYATCGLSDGVGTITVVGGSGSYNYSWSSGSATNTMMESGVTLVTITDTDATACELVLPVLMTNGNQAATTITDTLDISCTGNNDGGVVFDVIYESGFTTPIDTVITDGTNVYTNGSLPAGYYCITMVDTMGCIYGGDCFEVQSPDQIGVDIILDPSCTINRGVVLSPKGGSGDLIVDWADIPGTNDPLTRSDLPSGSYSFTITDANGCTVSIDDIALGTCTAQTTYFADTILVDEMPIYCIDTAMLSFNTPIDTIINACIGSSGDNVSFGIDQTSHCIDYTGIAIGRDSACIVVCDASMNCDTIIMIIDVVAGEYIRDTVIRLTDTITYSLNTSALNGNIVNLLDNCLDSHGTDVDFMVDSITFEVTYFGLGIGTDTLCLEMIDDAGSSYQTTFVVSSRDPIKEIYIDTIFSNQEVSYAFDLSEIGPTAGTIINECLSAGDTSVSFSIDEFRIDYLGLLPGTDTACLVSCNAAGVCDTLEMRIHVNFFPDPPIAVDDIDTTLVGIPITIHPALNDTIFGGVQEMELVDEPEWGDAFFNLEGSLTYNPDPKYCERWDEFRYQICNENSCDTALIRIFIECTDIKVFNAISPNDDGHNDYFHIANIDDFPNNVLRIYNRWNVLVYEIEGYSVLQEERRWKGTWQDEKDLPDGTYYYHLILNDTEKREFNGFLEIFR